MICSNGGISFFFELYIILNGFGELRICILKYIDLLLWFFLM